MIEMALVAMLVASVTVRTAAKGITDVAYAVRGKPSPRYDEARKRLRKPSGAASRYWSRVWEDAWTDALKKHDARRARREDGPSSSRPRGAGTVFAAGLFQDWWRAVRRSWDATLVRADEKRRAKVTRPRPGTTVVPGEVVPDSPVPSSSPVSSPSSSPAGAGVEVPAGDEDGDETPTTTTQDDHLADLFTPTERNTDMSTTIPTGEPTGVATGAAWATATADAFDTAVTAIEATLAQLEAAEITAGAGADFTSAQEHAAIAAAAMRAGGAKLQARVE